MTWTCTICEAVFRSFPAAQRHANEAHHGARISVDVATRRPA
jgi:uncharacterized C2H2 Zn-finger protein